jgi:hypothetical protein
MRSESLRSTRDAVGSFRLYPSCPPLPLVQSVTPASIRAARLKSAAGIAPIDTDGAITLLDDSAPEPRRRRDEETERDERRDVRPEREELDRSDEVPDARQFDRSDGPGEWSRRADSDEDLTRPPSLPASTTHQTHRPVAASFEPLVEKSPWRAPARQPKESDEKKSWTQGGGADNETTPDFGALKRTPTTGWAAARRAEGHAAEGPSSSSGAWSDADFLLLFPHLRIVRTVFDQATQSFPEATPRAEATSEQLAQIVGEVRRKHPELETLHLASTWIKVRKWRELLGATRVPVAESTGATRVPGAATESTEQQPPVLPDGFPANALHPRYYQPDIFMTVDEVSALLLKERDLLYLNIENAVVPRCQWRRRERRARVRME